jgi:hypothetical protein
MMHVNMSNREEEEEEEMEERERGGKNILLVKYSQGIEESAKTDNTPMKTARLSPLHNICCIRDGGLAQPDSCAAPTREEVAAVGGASLGEEADMDFSPGFCCCCCAIKPFQNPKPTQKHTHTLSLSLSLSLSRPRMLLLDQRIRQKKKEISPCRKQRGVDVRVRRIQATKQQSNKRSTLQKKSSNPKSPFGKLISHPKQIMRNPPTFCFLVLSLSLSLSLKERLSPENHAKSKCFVVTFYIQLKYFVAVIKKLLQFSLC